MTKQYNLNGVQGLVEQTRCQLSGTLTSIYHAEQSGLFDPSEGGQWVTVCEEHATFVQHRTLTIARFYRTFPSWCDTCAEHMGV